MENNMTDTQPKTGVRKAKVFDRATILAVAKAIAAGQEVTQMSRYHVEHAFLGKVANEIPKLGIRGRPKRKFVFTATGRKWYEQMLETEQPAPSIAKVKVAKTPKEPAKSKPLTAEQKARKNHMAMLRREAVKALKPVAA